MKSTTHGRTWISTHKLPLTLLGYNAQDVGVPDQATPYIWGFIGFSLLLAAGGCFWTAWLLRKPQVLNESLLDRLTVSVGDLGKMAQDSSRIALESNAAILDTLRQHSAVTRELAELIGFLKNDTVGTVERCLDRASRFYAKDNGVAFPRPEPLATPVADESDHLRPDEV